MVGLFCVRDLYGLISISSGFALRGELLLSLATKVTKNANPTAQPLRGPLRFSPIAAVAKLAALKQSLPQSAIACDAQLCKGARMKASLYAVKMDKEVLFSHSLRLSNGAKPGIKPAAV